MRIVRLPVVLLATLPETLAIAAPRPPVTAQYPDCAPEISHEARASPAPANPQALTDLPGAKVYYALVHTVDRCPVPILASARTLGGKR